MRRILSLVALLPLLLNISCGQVPTPTAKPRTTQIAQLTQVAAAVEASASARAAMPTVRRNPTALVTPPPAVVTPTPLPPLPAPAGWASYRGAKLPVDVIYPEDWAVRSEEDIMELFPGDPGWPVISFAPRWGTPNHRGLTIRRYASAIPGQDSAEETATQLISGVYARACEAGAPTEVTGPHLQMLSGLKFTRYNLRCTVEGLELTTSMLVALEENELGIKATWMLGVAIRGTINDDDYVTYIAPMLEQIRFR